MDKFNTFDKFLKQLNESAQHSNNLAEKYRLQGLAGIAINDPQSKYCILVSFGDEKGKSLITEHEKFQNFQQTTNRYLKHPANPDIPVQGHFHIYPNNGKKEIYSVNMDGTAHHKKNRGYEVPSKEAKELRQLGVNIPDNRIIENRQINFTGVIMDQLLILIE